MQSSCRVAFLLSVVFLQANATAATKPHTVAFGKWMTVQSMNDQWTASSRARDEKPLTLKVRPMLVDARVKEFTFGATHDITDRLFVVRRAFRINESLPQESALPPRWQWQTGGWLLVDRITGRIAAVSLPEFDSFYSPVAWYRDYAAYCGLSDDGRKVLALVVQLGRRKPVLKKAWEVGAITEGSKEDAGSEPACPAPAWQRAPTRVTFEPQGCPQQTFAIRGRIVGVIGEEEDEEDASK